MPRAVLLLCFAFGLRLAATQQAMPNDIIVASTPFGDGSDIMIYSAEGKLKTSLHTNFSVGYGTGSLGISGSAEYAFFGTSATSTSSDVNVDSRGLVAVVRIAGGKPKYLGSFHGGKDINFGTNKIASGDVSASGDAFVYVSEGVYSKACKAIKSLSKATRFVQLRFTPGRDGQKSSLRRVKVFDAYTSSKCSEDLEVLGMRTIGNNLYVVFEDSGIRIPGSRGVPSYTMRSYDAFTSKPKRSTPILRYNASRLSAVTIDSPTSFVALSDKPGVNEQFNTYQVRIEKGKKPLFGANAPGPTYGNKYSERIYYGGFSSYADGKSIIAATGNINNRGFGPIGNFIYKFDAKSLVNPRRLFRLEKTVQGEDLVVVQKPRKLPV